MIKIFTEKKKEIKSILKLIKKYDKIALFHHVYPDGDTISTSYGLLLAIKQRYPEKKVVFVPNEKYLKEHFGFLKFEKKYIAKQIDNDYLTIIGDVSESERIENYEEFAKGKEKICFDHHRNDTNLDVAVFWHEPNWGASAMQAIVLGFMLNKNLNEDTAFFLTIGLLTDTNNFSYTQADQKGPYFYSKLLPYISDEKMDNLFRAFKRKTKKDLEMTKFILNNMKFDKRVSYIVIDKKTLKKFGNDDANFKFKVNLIGNVENYPMWAMFTETGNDPERPWDLSIRSTNLDIRQVAVKYKGGGHLRAAGASLKNKAEIKKVINDLNKIKN